MLGTSIDAIKCTEDRQKFAEKLNCIGENVAFGKAASSVEEVTLHPNLEIYYLYLLH